MLLSASNVMTELHGDRAHEFVARLLGLKLEILKARESGEVQAIDDRSHNGIYAPTSCSSPMRTSHGIKGVLGAWVVFTVC